MASLPPWPLWPWPEPTTVTRRRLHGGERLVVCGGEFKLGNNGGQERGDCTESTVGRENLPWHGTAWHGSGTTGTPAALSPAPCAEPPMWGDAKSRESSFTPSLFPVLPWALVGLRMGLGHGGPAKPFTPRANATAGGGAHSVGIPGAVCSARAPLAAAVLAQPANISSVGR